MAFKSYLGIRTIMHRPNNNTPVHIEKRASASRPVAFVFGTVFAQTWLSSKVVWFLTFLK